MFGQYGLLRRRSSSRLRLEQMESRLLPGETLGALLWSPLNPFTEDGLTTPEVARPASPALPGLEAVPAAGFQDARLLPGTAALGPGANSSPPAAPLPFADALRINELDQMVGVLAGSLNLPGGPTITGELVTNGGFEDPDFAGAWRAYFEGSTELTGWEILGAGVVQVGTSWQPAAGNYSVELNFYAAGGIYQYLPTVPGQDYLLTFDMAGQPDVGPPVKGLEVYWDGEWVGSFDFDTTGHSFLDMGWTTQAVWLPPATGEYTSLVFYGSVPDSGDGGPAIDNVSVVACC